MRLTYPHMGEAYIAIKSLFDDIGVESTIPSFTTDTTLRLGAALSPETICLPFKIMLGNYINSIKAGADTVLITGSCGPCRYGYYGPIQQQILREAGYRDIDIIVLDPPREGYRDFYAAVKKLSHRGRTHPLQAVLTAYRVSCAVDALNDLLYHIRPRAVNKAEVRAILHRFKEQVTQACGSAEILKMVEETGNALKQVEINNEIKPLKIGIIGEIYTIIEPFTNLNIEERLGEMGMEVHRSMTVRSWIQNTLIKPMTGRKSYVLEKKLSKPYLPAMIGGHAQQCIGHAVQYAQMGYDGLIQIYPMTCMPEIVSRSILPQVEKDYGIPILYLIVDEQTGMAGYVTRIEAFVDCVARRKKEMLHE